MVRRIACKLPRTVVMLFLHGAAIAAGAQAKPLVATVCEITQNPVRFDNRIVELRATLAGNFEISAIRDPDHQNCGSLWFTYPGSGPQASVSMNSLVPTQSRPTITLKKDDAFRRFQALVDAKMYPRARKNLCIGCSRYEVSATMTGLVEFAGPVHGFGHMNGFPVQFVLQSIKETSVKDLASRYSAADFSTKPIRFPTGYISGILVGPDGKHIADADLTVYSPTDPEAHIEDDSATTDDHGHFRFAVPPGQYVIGFNTFWPPSPSFPYPPTYYPSSPEKSGAQVVAVRDREHKDNVVIQLPKPLLQRTIAVQVLWPDGKPVKDANVWLSQKSDPTFVVGTSVSHTTEDGNFNLIGFKGIDYILHADKYGGLAKVSCIKPILIRASQSLPTPILLRLVITDYGTCTDGAFESPVELAEP
jgi:hypothetical protein